jgi:hypothetical protein
MQIVFPDEKDVKDVMLLLRAHDIALLEEDNQINAKFISTRLASDWGFWYTMTTNIKGLKQYVSEAQNLTESEKQDLTSKLNKLLESIENEPKSTGWKMRSITGARRKWYNPVETSQTVGEFGIWKLREGK